MTKSILYELLDNLPEYMDKSEGKNIYNFIYSLSLSLETFNDNIDSLKSEIQIDTAQAQYLDDIGKLFTLLRKSDEVDASYRARIKTFISSYIGGGTIAALKQAVSDITDISTSEINVTEIDFMKVLLDVVLNTDELIASASTISDSVDNTKAAGIYLFKNIIITGDSFSEELTLSDAVLVESTEQGFFTAGVSLAGGPDVV